MKHIITNTKKYKYIYVLALPSTIYVIVFKIIPLYGLQIAFKDFNFREGITRSELVGFKNFITLFSRSEFWQALENTITLGLMHLIFSFPVAILIAIFFSEMNNKKMQRIVQTISTFPHFLSWVLVASLFFNIFGNYGIINNIINSFFGSKISFFSSPGIFRWILILSYIWKESGWNSIIYFAAICGIDKSLYEAAKLDGANSIKCMKHVTLPGLKKIIIAMFLIQIGNIFTAGFGQIYNLYNSTVYSSADVLETYIYRITFLSGNNFGISAAAGLVEAVLNIITLLFAELLCRKLTDTSLFLDLFSSSNKSDNMY